MEYQDVVVILLLVIVKSLVSGNTGNEDFTGGSNLLRLSFKKELVPLGHEASVSRSTENEETVHLETSLLIGGVESQENAWPWQVLVSITRKLRSRKVTTIQICGGTLITTEWVLTAAHCFANHSDLYPVSAEDIIVQAGVHNRRTYYGTIVQTSGVEDFYTHDNYSFVVMMPAPEEVMTIGIFLGNDVTLLKLKKEMQMTKFVKTISLLTNSSNWKTSDEWSCRATGWGITDAQASNTSHVLREVELLPYNRSYCDSFFRQLVKQELAKTKGRNLTDEELWSFKTPSTAFCAGPSEDKVADTCRGDSGGPLVCRHNDTKVWLQVGVTSFGNENCTSEAAFFISVPHILPWIEKIIPHITYPSTLRQTSSSTKTSAFSFVVSFVACLVRFILTRCY